MQVPHGNSDILLLVWKKYQVQTFWGLSFVTLIESVQVSHICESHFNR